MFKYTYKVDIQNRNTAIMYLSIDSYFIHSLRDAMTS